MFATVKPDRRWSGIGLWVLIWSIVAMVVLSLADGVMRGPIAYQHLVDDRGNLAMLATWVSDFRYFAEQAIYAATIFFVGAKFFETRSVLTIGFDRIDAGKISVKGPDADNIVWIGHRYGTPVEAQAVADAFAERLKQSAAGAG